MFTLRGLGGCNPLVDLLLGICIDALAAIDCHDDEHALRGTEPGQAASANTSKVTMHARTTSDSRLCHSGKSLKLRKK